MTTRTVTDTTGRIWTCAAESAAAGSSSMGRDVVLSCATPSVGVPVLLTIGWQWEKMAATGLARLLNLASPVPRR